MKQRIHRDKLMFHWITEHYEIVMGVKRVRYGPCRLCGKRISKRDSLCDICFAKDKDSVRNDIGVCLSLFWIRFWIF